MNDPVLLAILSQPYSLDSVKPHFRWDRTSVIAVNCIRSLMNLLFCPRATFLFVRSFFVCLFVFVSFKQGSYGS